MSCEATSRFTFLGRGAAREREWAVVVVLPPSSTSGQLESASLLSSLQSPRTYLSAECRVSRIQERGPVKDGTDTN